FSLVPPARADIVSAFKDYKKGDYPHAFQEFLALAQLGQPLAQFDVATLYHAGQGTAANDTEAYAWATLAAASGEARGKALADAIRPTLPAGAEQAAAAVTLPYTDAALQQTLFARSVCSPAAGLALYPTRSGARLQTHRDSHRNRNSPPDTRSGDADD